MPPFIPHPRAGRRAAWLLLLVALALGLMGCSGQRQVTLVLDGQAQDVTTRARTVAELLQEAGIAVGPEDRVRPDLAATLTGEEVRVDRARPVRVLADGQLTSLLTTERRPDRLLDQAEVALEPGDLVLTDGLPLVLDQSLPSTAEITLQVRRAVSVTLQGDEEVTTFRSAAPSLGTALWEAGIRLHDADRVEPGLETPLDGPLVVKVQRSRPLQVTLEGSIINVRTTASTVGAALREAGLSLQGLDYSIPPEGSPLPADGKVRIVHVQEQIVLEEKPLPFETEFRLDPAVELDTRAMTHPGAFGVEAARVRIRLEDGQEVARREEGQWVALEPHPRVMSLGTQIVTRTLETEYGPLEYWRAIPMYATSYSPCRQGYDFCSTGTASGATLQKGVAAMLVRHYLAMAGSRVYVPGYGIATILDTGGGIPGRNWIDLGYGEEDYVSWHQWVTVYFLSPPPLKN